MRTKRTALFFLLTWATAFLCDFSSTRTVIPFGWYFYTGSTRGQELYLSNVPFMDSLSFSFLLFMSYCLALVFLLPGRGHGLSLEVCDDPAIRRSGPVLALTTLFFVLLDVVIDPVTLRGDRWFLGKIYDYPEPGVHFGVPMANYLGWAVVGLVALGAFQRIERRLPDAASTLIIAAVLLPLVWFGTAAMHFPSVFQVMFMIYILLGLGVFLLLDAPAVPRLEGWKAVSTLLAFYLVVSAAYILGASYLPQYDPAVEMGKIEKIVKPKMETPDARRARLEALLKQAEDLQAKTETLQAKLEKLAPEPKPVGEVRTAAAGPTDLVARGKEVYELQECYNCHKIGGKGSVKKRGPELDNIGNLLTQDDIKKKVFDPGYLYADGFEKEHKKGLMPDKYKELMTDEEVNALAAYLATLKNPAAPTPKPIFVKTKVEHGFIVYGY